MMREATGGASPVSRSMHVPFESIRLPEVAEGVRAAEALLANDGEAAIESLRSLAGRHPEDGDAWFALGGAYDTLGHESEAVTCYEKALELYPNAPWLRFLCLQLGSSYRNVGRLDDARRLLERGTREFPDMKSLSVFLAYVQHDLGQHGAAVRTLVEALLSTAPQSLAPYGRAVAGYLEDIS